MTISLMPKIYCQQGRFTDWTCHFTLTRILCVFGTHVFVASVKHILVHEGCTRCDLSEERNLDRLADLDSLALLYEDLACVLAPVLSIERRHTVLFGVVTLLERLQGCHEVVATSNARGDDTLGNTSSDSTLHDGGDGVHGSDDLVLELRRDVQLDLLEEVF